MKRSIVLTFALALSAAGVACSGDGGGRWSRRHGRLRRQRRPRRHRWLAGGTTGGSSSTGGTGGSTGGTGGSTGGTGGSTGGTGGSTGGTGGSTGGTGGSTGGTGGSTGGTGGSSTDGGKMDTMDGSGTEGGGTGALMWTSPGDFTMMGNRLCFKNGQTAATGPNRSPRLDVDGNPTRRDTELRTQPSRYRWRHPHWVMWDIPPDTRMLPACLPKGVMPPATPPMGNWYGVRTWWRLDQPRLLRPRRGRRPR